MATIYKVSQFPQGDIQDGVIYYNRSTREVLLNTPSGKQKFQAVYVPKEIDVISIAGYYPLLTSELLAKQKSPSGTATAYGLAELGPPPPGVSYPVWMPDGLAKSYLGNYIDPIGDLDGDGILNFRDPDLLGIAALPTVGYTPPAPYITSGGVSIDIDSLLDNPDSGTLNNTSDPITVFVHSSGVIIGPNGEIKYFIGPGAASIPPGWVLFQDSGKTSSPLPQPSPAYTSDPFITAGGNSVNITSLISNPDNGSFNGGSSPINIETIDSGIIVCDNGSVTYFMPGKVTINPGCTMFRDVGNSTSPLNQPTPAYTSDPFTTSNGVSVNIKDYLSNPDGGSLNDTGLPITIQLSEPSVLVGPDGTVTVLSPIPGSHTIPPGFVLFTNQSTFVNVANTSLGVTPTPPSPVSSSSIQWFEDLNGSLVLRTVSFTDNTGLQFWEESGSDAYTPRDGAYSSTSDSYQYFEEDSNGDIIPRNNPII